MAFQKRPQQEQPKPKVEIEAPTTETEKFKALFTLGKALDKKHESMNSLMRLGGNSPRMVIPSIPTGLPSLDDEVLGCGGVPRGRVVEIFGPESAGKTTIALHILGKEQKAGGLGAFVDAEHALDPTYAGHLGVDVEKLVLSQPDSGEQALDTTRELVRSKCVSIIVVDSVAALVPEAELAGEIGDAHVGLQARMMSQAMRMLVGEAQKNLVTVIFINQIREKIGVMFGNPETTTGGRALKFYSSVRLDVRRREPITLKKDGFPIGHELEVKAVKNKCAAPFRSTKLNLYYPNNEAFIPAGLDQIGDLIAVASKKGLFEMSGSWYHMDLGRIDPETKKPLGKERLANGLANLQNTLRDDTEAVAIIRKQLHLLLAAERKTASDAKDSI